jgi:hypothetical protein
MLDKLKNEPLLLGGGLFLIVSFVALVVLMVMDACGAVDKPKEPRDPIPAPDVHAPEPPPATTLIDVQAWTPVENVDDVLGRWRIKEGYDEAGGKLWIRKRSEDGGGSYTGIYPYRLDYQPPEPYEPDDIALEILRCGFYPAREELWRVAYCEGYSRPATEGAHVYRLILHVPHEDNDSLRLQIGSILELYFRRVTDWGDEPGE